MTTPTGNKQDMLIILVVALLLLPAAIAGAAPLESAGSDVLAGAKWTTERRWQGRDSDHGSVHCLGNGHLCVYEQGPDIIQVFGPPYSATTIGTVTLEGADVTCESRRVRGAAIWRHEIARDGEAIAAFTDFVDIDTPCLVRMIHATEPVTFVYTPEPDLRIAGHTTAAMDERGAVGGLLIETPIGKPLVPFGRYPLPFAVFNQFVWTGNVQVEHAEESLRLIFAPGDSELYVSGGPCVDQCIARMEAALGSPAEALLSRTMDAWQRFTAEGKDFEATLPADVPMRERLVQVLDDVAVMIKAQQAAEGGVMAGYPYHLGYVRDQYGVHRGLVALGHEEMSRDILEFYFEVFERGGMIRNAQAFGVPGVYHVHENDDVEITGYIMLQAFDYLQRTGDVAFIKQILPMLAWAWDVQQPHLVEDMLPFNGDETYVAGGILPRSALNDGSAEATLLFIESGERLLDFAEEHGLWDSALIAAGRNTVTRVREAFRPNFWRDNRLITNNPARVAAGEMPASRHGVCERCITVQWTRRTENGRYVCVECFGEEPLPAVEPQAYQLQSVSLTPLYFHASLPAVEELRPQVEGIFSEYQRTGTLPSRPDGGVAVGYDYGLLLYALTEIGHSGARAFYEKTLSLADDTGAWAEYYRDHAPTNTRCRPWESAINVEAILHWIETEYGE